VRADITVIAVALPPELREAIEEQLRAAAPGELARAAADLSVRYRAGQGGWRATHSPTHLLAYAAVRLPATYAAITTALERVQELRPNWRPRTLLDLGTGLGAGVWAAATVWDSLRRVTALDADPRALALAQELARSAVHPAVRSASWRRAALTEPLPDIAADLVLIAYVLGELAPAAADTLVERAWQAATDTLVIVEPGTPAGYGRVIAARGRLLSQGAFTTAPCPHDAPCPLVDDWCHFAVRLPRSRLHRTLKQGALGYEDEKFSYVALSRAPTGRAPARVIRHPQVHPGRIGLTLCTRQGIRTVTVTRADRDRFRQARKTVWGDVFAEGDASPQASG
jgi:ribosomal protein RSM22 (predicted rRNA methylase)